MSKAKMREKFYLLTGKLSSSHSGEYRAFKIAWQAALASRDAEVKAIKRSNTIATNSWKAETAELLKTQREVEELKTKLDAFTDALASVEKEHDELRERLVEIDAMEPVLWVDMMILPVAVSVGLPSIMCSFTKYDEDYYPLYAFKKEAS